MDYMTPVITLATCIVLIYLTRELFDLPKTRTCLLKITTPADVNVTTTAPAAHVTRWIPPPSFSTMTLHPPPLPHPAPFYVSPPLLAAHHQQEQPDGSNDPTTAPPLVAPQTTTTGRLLNDISVENTIDDVFGALFKPTGVSASSTVPPQ
jgi:hypothetical protein